MAREHKFRGKRVDNGEWVHGYYNGCYETATIDYLKNGIPWNVCVIPETVGEYTGEKDKNGNEIYEGSIYIPEFGHVPRVVKWYKSGWWFFTPRNEPWRRLGDTEFGEVIGDIYTTPELLEV